jgi:DNA replicative helicase MCM subunit Mcm2 (Cdc46/Mcm family)
MLESLIRLAEANARLHLRDEAGMFDAVTVILLVDQTLATGLFHGEQPSPVFSSVQEYKHVARVLLANLELDSDRLFSAKDTEKRERTPSPIKKVADSLLIGGDQDHE